MNNTVYVMCNTVLWVLIFYCLHFDIIAKSADFPNLQCEKSILLIYLLYSVSKDRFFHNFVILLKWQCRLGKFQVFFFINFTVWTVSIFIITLRLYDLSSKLYHYTVYFLLKTTKYFQCINVMFNPCACMCDLIIHCIIFQVKLALLTLWICQ